MLLHGTRARDDGRYEKTRWRCVRTVEGVLVPHYWTTPRPTPTADHPDGQTCGSCEHEVKRAEGPTVVPDFGYAVAEAARTLVLVDEGKSLREASQKVRYGAGRFSSDRHGHRWASRQNPEPVPEWDVAGNEKRTPDRTKATSDRPVLWLSPDEPGKHPSYPMSPMARSNWLTRARPGCPECRKRLTKAARRALKVRTGAATGAASAASP